MASTFQASLGKITTTQKILVAFLLLVLLGAGWFFLFYSPKIDELDSKTDEKASAEAQLAAALKDYRDWVQLSQDLERARGQLEELNKLLPTTRDVEGLMTGINAQAKDAQLRLTNIVPEDELEDASGMYIRIPIRIQFRGTFHQVLKFFDSIDTTITRLVNMENIQISLKASDDEPDLLEGAVRATTFMARQPGDAAEEPAKAGARSRRRSK